MGKSVLVPHRTPRHGYKLVESDVLGICERLQRGDPTCNWEGDPRLFVRFNELRRLYEVWRLCEDGVERIISSHKPNEFGPNVLKYLAEHDSHHVDINATLDKHNERVDASHQRQLEDLEHELNKYLKWANKKLGFTD